MKVRFVPNVRVAESVVMIVLLIATGGAAYYLLTTARHAVEIYDAASRAAAGTPVISQTNNCDPTRGNTYSDLKYGFSMCISSTWKTATGGYDDAKTNRCGQSVLVDPQPVCVAHIMLIPANETFSNPDQYHIDVNIFKLSAPSTAASWLGSLGLSSDVGGQQQRMTINGKDAIYYHVPYGQDEIRVRYGIVSKSYGVLVNTSAFTGNYYSYKNTKNVDYRTYLPQVRLLAQSVKISD